MMNSNISTTNISTLSSNINIADNIIISYPIEITSIGWSNNSYITNNSLVNNKCMMIMNSLNNYLTSREYLIDDDII